MNWFLVLTLGVLAVWLLGTVGVVLWFALWKPREDIAFYSDLENSPDNW